MVFHILLHHHDLRLWRWASKDSSRDIRYIWTPVVFHNKDHHSKFYSFPKYKSVTAMVSVVFIFVTSNEGLEGGGTNSNDLFIKLAYLNFWSLELFSASSGFPGLSKGSMSPPSKARCSECPVILIWFVFLLAYITTDGLLLKWHKMEHISEGYKYTNIYNHVYGKVILKYTILTCFNSRLHRWDRCL